jgi:hypothetical protein
LGKATAVSSFFAQSQLFYTGTRLEALFAAHAPTEFTTCSSFLMPDFFLLLAKKRILHLQDSFSVAEGRFELSTPRV